MRVNLVVLVMAACLAQVYMFEKTEDQTLQSPQMQETEPQEFQVLDQEEPVKRKRIEDVPGLTEDMLIETINEAKKETQEEEAKTPRVVQLDGAPQTHQSAHYRRFVPELEPARINAMVKERTIKKLADKLGLSHKEGASALEGLESNEDGCKPMPPAEDPRNMVPPPNYRSIDGRRNNLKHIEYGRANTPFTRLLPAEYSDGISKPRKAASGKDLPNARNVSRVVFKNENHPSSKLSHMVMIWGQFIDHDIALGAQPNIDCSKSCVNVSRGCFGIPIPAGDQPFAGKKCIELKRDVPACTSQIKREQINTITSFIDGSGVYSSSPKDFNSLRDLNRRGFIVEKPNPTKGLKNMLATEKGGYCRSTDQVKMPCFRAGDERVNENAGLASMHTIWSREHNRIVSKLTRINPQWTSDKLYLEARKIVGAMIQHVTYKEFLPAILDYRTRRRFKLRLYSRYISRHGRYRRYSYYFPHYNKNVNPSIFNAFGAAAYRFGHSLVQNQFNRFGKSYAPINPFIWMNRFFDTSFLYQSHKGGVDAILRGLVKDKAQKVDRFFAKAVQEQLVRFPHDLADLPALNIQRGREHGIPGYNKYRKFGRGLKEALNFDGLRDVMEKAKINKLKSVYEHVNDLDLFVGALYEKPVRGGVLGPTFSAIIAEQFKRLRNGDRFWYENKGQFTRSQLREIRKTTLARVICDNSDGIIKIYKYVMRRKYFRSCKYLKKVNLWKWKKRRFYYYHGFHYHGHGK